MTLLIQLVSACFGSLGFAGLFHVRGKKLLFAALGGTVSWAGYLLLQMVWSNLFLSYFCCGVIATIYAELFARILKSPTTTFLIPALIPAVPGGMLYSTMNAMVENDWSAAANFANQTLIIALTLAGGVMVVTSIQKIITGFGKGEQCGKKAV